MKPIGLLLLIVLLVVGLLWLQRGLQVFRHRLAEYAPTPYDATEAGRALLAQGRAELEAVHWTLDDGTRQAAYWAPPRDGAVVLFAHGSPGHGLAHLRDEGRGLRERGHGVLLIDLPGYGASEGDRRWGASFVESFRRGLDFVSTQPGVRPEWIVAFGYSNGGSVVARAARDDERVRALALLASYTRLADQLHAAYAGRRMPALGSFAVAAARRAGVPLEELDVEAALRAMSPRPTLLLWGALDREVPPAMGRQLASVLPHAEAVEYPGVGHSGFVDGLGPIYLDRLDRFYREATNLPIQDPSQPKKKSSDSPGGADP